MSELSPEYYARYVEAARSHWWFRGRERIVAEVAGPLVRAGSLDTVVDVGSGPGGPARAVFPGARIVAVDLSLAVLRAYAGADARIAGDAARLPLASGCVSVICAFDVLEHLEDDREALRQWRASLKPGGWLIVTVPAYRQLWSAHDEVNQHRRRYRGRELGAALREAGLRVVRMTYFNTVLLPGIALARWSERLRPRSAARRIQAGELDLDRRLPAWAQRWCEGALRLEARWLRHGELPAGVSICAVAQAVG